MHKEPMFILLSAISTTSWGSFPFISVLYSSLLNHDFTLIMLKHSFLSNPDSFQSAVLLCYLLRASTNVLSKLYLQIRYWVACCQELVPVGFN